MTRSNHHRPNHRRPNHRRPNHRRPNHHRLGVAVAVGALSLAGSASIVFATAPPTTADPTTTDPTVPTTVAAGPSGLLCGALDDEGGGGVAGMAGDPLATVVGNVPALSRLAALVTTAGLEETLSQDGLTVFAPINSAFDKIDPATLEGVLADTDLLTGILAHHVIPQRLSSADLVSGGTFVTAHGHEAALAVDIVGETLVIDGGAAAVLCGEVPTANATVYLIDSVLMPPTEEEPVDTTEAVETTSVAETTEVLVETTEAVVVETTVSGTAAEDEDGGQIEFPEGTTSASVEGTTSNQSFDSWSVAGLSGQLLEVSVSSEEGNVSFDVFSTTGDPLADDQTSASIPLPADGLYAIEVGTGANSADYTLSVSVTG